MFNEWLALGGVIDPRLTMASLVCAGLAAAILIWFLLWRPKLTPATKIVLFFGLGAFPLAAAFTGNVVGYERTKTREFCSSCHVMEPYTEDVADPDSHTLAAMHSRNEAFGGESCYVCHSDYGMYGTVLTKVAGLKHAYYYYTEYRDKSIEEALPELQIYEPFPNGNCTRCHSTTLEDFLNQKDHRGLKKELAAGEVSCASAGCHGPAHPFSKTARERAGKPTTVPPNPLEREHSKEDAVDTDEPAKEER